MNAVLEKNRKVVQDIALWKKSIYEKIDELKKKFNESLIVPAYIHYEIMPETMANLKSKYIIDKFNLHTRLTFLGCGNIFGFYLNKHLKQQNKLYGACKQTFYSFFFLGLFIVPELFNPFWTNYKMINQAPNQVLK